MNCIASILGVDKCKTSIPLKQTLIIWMICLNLVSGCIQGKAENSTCLEPTLAASVAQNPVQDTNLLFPIVRNRKWGFIDVTGKVIIEPKLNYTEGFSEERAAFKNGNGKWGFIDPTGRVVIEPQFDGVHQFYEQRAAVKIGEKWGFIEPQGKFIIQPRFTQVSRFFEGRAAVESGYLWGFIDTDGQFIVEPKFTGYTDFSEGLAGFDISQNNQYKTGFIDRSGKVVIELQDINVDIEGVGFRNGLAPVWVRSPGIWGFIDSILDDSGRGRKFWGFIDRSGKIAIPLKYDSVINFSECLAPVETGGKWGFINTSGEMVIQPQFGDWFSGFSEGLASVKINQKEGYIDKTGKIVIKPQFFLATRFSEGLAAVQIEEGGKWGFIDRTGKMAIAPQFDDSGLFSKGLAQVKIDGKLGYIDKKRKYIWSPTK